MVDIARVLASRVSGHHLNIETLKNQDITNSGPLVFKTWVILIVKIYVETGS